MAICREDKEKKSETIRIRKEKTKLFANDITLCTDTPKEASKKTSRNKKSLAKLLEIKIKYAGRALHQPGGGTFLFFTQRPQQAPGDLGWTIWYRVTDVENAPTTPEGWPQEAIAAPPWTQQPAGWQSRDRLSPCHRPLLPERETASSRCRMECVGNNWITLGSPFKGGEESKSLTYSSLIMSSVWITPSLHPQDPEGEEFPKHWKGVWRLGCWEDCHTLTCRCCFRYLFLFWPFWHSKEQTNEMPKCNKRLWEVSWNSPCTSEDLNWKKIFF